MGGNPSNIKRAKKYDRRKVPQKTKAKKKANNEVWGDLLFEPNFSF